MNPESIAVLEAKQKGKPVTPGTPLGIYNKKCAFPVPAEKYVKEMSILDRAKALVGKPIILSENKSEAAKQLAEIGINIEEMRKEAEAQQIQPE